MIINQKKTNLTVPDFRPDYFLLISFLISYYIYVKYDSEGEYKP